MSNNNILFYGPLGGKDGKIIGGGESGNKKTIAILNRLGFRIFTIEKPYPSENGFLSSITFPIKLILTYFKFVVKLFKSQFSSFHLSGFYNHLIYTELLFIFTSKIFGINSVYEIRAGGAIESYELGSSLYKWFFKKTLEMSSYVICQGEIYIDFVKQISAKDALYYPNYILDSMIVPYSNERRDNTDVIKLVYFGRIAPSKNIEFIIDICNNLKPLNFNLEVIGTGQNDYVEKLRKYIADLGINNNVIISPACAPDKLLDTMLEKHFFIFPSKEKREGHSNSLTEAMSRGLVPLASNAGFNSSVVRNDFLIINNFSPIEYANKIKDIWVSDKWHQLSRESYYTVVNNFTEHAVEHVLLKIHRQYVYAMAE